MEDKCYVGSWPRKELIYQRLVVILPFCSCFMVCSHKHEPMFLKLNGNAQVHSQGCIE